jgi:hypothetical protein
MPLDLQTSRPRLGAIVVGCQPIIILVNENHNTSSDIYAQHRID